METIANDAARKLQEAGVNIPAPLYATQVLRTRITPDDLLLVINRLHELWSAQDTTAGCDHADLGDDDPFAVLLPDDQETS